MLVLPRLLPYKSQLWVTGGTLCSARPEQAGFIKAQLAVLGTVLHAVSAAVGEQWC